MKKFTFFILFLTVGFSLFSYYPNNFFGEETRAPVTTYEMDIVFTFGTYHKESSHKYKALRLNSLDSNHKPVRKKIYERNSNPDSPWFLEHIIEYNYDTEGKIDSIVKINPNNDSSETIVQYEYYDSYVMRVNIPDDISFYYNGIQSVTVEYYDYNDEYQTNMLITYLINDEGLPLGWFGRNYAFNSDIFSIGYFNYDEQSRLDYIFYETPATREHVVIEDTLYWDEDKLVSLQSNHTSQQLEYNSNELISHITVHHNYNNYRYKYYYYSYDQYGRMTNEKMETYCNNILDDVYKYEYEYNEYVHATNEPELDKPSIELIGNYPNPFNPRTTINFSLNKKQKVNLSIYNIKGQKIKTLLNKKAEVGKHHIEWDGTDNNDQAVSSGVYLYKLNTSYQTMTKRMILLK